MQISPLGKGIIKISLDPREEGIEHTLYLFCSVSMNLGQNEIKWYRLTNLDGNGNWQAGPVPPLSTLYGWWLLETTTGKIPESELIKLDSSISTGWVYKFLIPCKEWEFEHSIQILISGSIKRHPHFERHGLTEGYREFNPVSGKMDNWQVVGPGMPKTFHSVPFHSGLWIVEASKRGPGIEAWPELQQQ